ncbi:hypothetical protein M9Y10_003964 [Tritrichomonas musculus]|uniref:CXXC-rich protein n=1 Tax=Tritrichomonas musculus TaxID=1915356 RepID=A0ABR2JR21_9EUKA
MFCLVLIIEFCTLSKSISCSNFIGCEECTESKCTKCYSTQGFDNDELSETYGQCKPCELRCISCDNDYKICQSCIAFYGVDTNISSSEYGKCVNCQNSNCHLCNDDYTKCYSCYNGYGKDTDKNSDTYGKCIKCMTPKCLLCAKDAYKCTDCDDYTILDKDVNSETYNKCISCPFNCQKCSKESTCQTCGDGTGRNKNGECVKCLDPNCNSCLNNYSICTDCLYPLGVDTNRSSPTYGKCVECQGLCTRCESKNAYKCNSCEDGYYAKDQKCVPCTDTNCNKCNYGLCSSCSPGYYLSYYTCQKIPIESCEDYTGNYCNRCKQNYYYDTKQKLCLKANMDNCNISLDLTQCKSCIKGFGLDENGKCVQCQDSNCEECSNDYKKCTYCIENHFLDIKNGICLNNCNIDNCVKCSRKGGCEECDPLYNLISNSCYKKEDPYCLSYYISYCERCSLGYGVNVSYCVPCDDPNCRDCSKDYKYCNSCNDGYVKSEGYNGNCLKCLVDHCSSCTKNINLCEECESGYGLDLSKGSSSYGKCVSCSDYGCTECNFNPKHCKENEKPIDQISNSFSSDIFISPFDEPSSNPNDENDHKPKDKKLSTGAIVGISVGSVAAAALIITISVCLCRKKIPVEAISN